MFDIEFLLTSFVVVVVPGTGVIYTVSTGLTQRSRAGVAAAIGCTLGIVPHLVASIVGLSALLHASARVFQVLRYVGAAYLLYVAWRMWRETGRITFGGNSNRSGAYRIALRGILINLLNPKLTMFFFAFLPLFVSTDSIAPAREMLGLSAVFMGMTFVVFVVYGLLAGAVSRRAGQSPRLVVRVQRSFAIVLAALAARLALSDE